MLTYKKFKLVAIVSMAPILLWPLMLTHTDGLQSGTERFVMLAMPAYAVLAGALSSYTYRDRPTLSWVLIALLWLSYVAFAVLVYFN